MKHMKRDKTYAYVTTGSCVRMDAVKPGSFIGRNEIPVSKHGDYCKWPWCKKDTLNLVANGGSEYDRNAARAVAQLLGWAR
jgi:hypothetical protein